MKSTVLALCCCVSPALADEAVVGIFGAVDRLDPLTVAGVVVLRPEGVPVISALGPDQTLAPGDTLAIRARVTPQGVTALRLLEVYPIAGPISASADGEARVMGTPVHLPSNSDFKAGDWVAFSGFWSGTKVITTATRRIEGGGIAQLTGTLTLEDAAPLPRIGESAASGVQIPEGDFDDHVWTLTGTPTDTGLRAFLTARGLFGGDVDLEVWEGYASGPVASETWRVFGTGVYGYDRERDMPQAGSAVRVCAAAGRVLRRAPGEGAAWAALGCDQ
ncbi:hypothetical protein KDD17_13580 [Sulfitobacter albidus]|uniref:DUF5666 domain-containing protein n=1 Tax=Sulfitobacter albidus TaxID=2829501 RepID=A0A975PLR0_9RHOB|nr:hypothetical protein [Sulfitobacter albidus]QUJ75949.1 hypothetical protein KDD17_13580 [Sulfitobacter albidus]